MCCTLLSPLKHKALDLSTATTLSMECSGPSSCETLVFAAITSSSTSINCDGSNSCQWTSFDFSSSTGTVTIDCNSQAACLSSEFNGIQLIQDMIVNCHDFQASCNFLQITCPNPDYDAFFAIHTASKLCHVTLDGSQTTSSASISSHFGYDAIDVQCLDNSLTIPFVSGVDTLQSATTKITNVHNTYSFSCESMTILCNGDEFSCTLEYSIKSNPLLNITGNRSISEFIEWECVGSNACVDPVFFTPSDAPSDSPSRAPTDAPTNQDVYLNYIGPNNTAPSVINCTEQSNGTALNCYIYW